MVGEEETRASYRGGATSRRWTPSEAPGHRKVTAESAAPLSRLGHEVGHFYVRQLGDREASMTRVGLLGQSCWFTLMLFDDHVFGFRRHDLLYVSSLMPGPEDELS